MAEIIVSEQHKQAVALNQKIIVSAELAQQNLWEMCVSLKQMRDGKLYKELGYSNFEDYCENEIGFSARNARNYISIVEKVNIQNGNSSSAFERLGVKKLALLATISEQEQAEIAERVDLENTTVKQLKAEIERLKEETQQKLSMASYKQLDAESTLKRVQEYSEDLEKKLKAEIEKLKAEKALKQQELSSAVYERDTAKSEKIKLKNENSKLKEKVEELESRPVEVAVVDNTAENDRKLQEVIRSLERENIIKNEELEQAYREQEQDVRRMLEQEKQTALSEKQKEIDTLKAELEKSGSHDNDETIEYKAALQNAENALKNLLVVLAKHAISSYDSICLVQKFIEDCEKIGGTKDV